MKEEKIRKELDRLGISEECIEEVLTVAKRMDDKGLVNSFAGNISTKKDGKIYITPTGQNKALLTADKIAVLDENDKRVWGYKGNGGLRPHRSVSYGTACHIARLPYSKKKSVTVPWTAS